MREATVFQGAFAELEVAAKRHDSLVLFARHRDSRRVDRIETSSTEGRPREFRRLRSGDGGSSIIDGRGCQRCCSRRSSGSEASRRMGGAGSSCGVESCGRLLSRTKVHFNERAAWYATDFDRELISDRNAYSLQQSTSVIDVIARGD